MTHAARARDFVADAERTTWHDGAPSGICWVRIQWRAAMAARKRRGKRDIEKDYSRKQFITKLRRLADCLESDQRFRIQVAGERVSIPPNATINIEHERGSSEEEIEFQLKWPLES